MRQKNCRSQVILIVFFVAGSVLLPAILSAQTVKTAPQYVVVQLGSLGGTVGRSNAVNDRGWVSGWWNLPGDANHHAVLWIDGQPNDLGTLGGPNSEIEFI